MTEPRTVIVLTGRHRPHQIAFMTFSVLCGIVFTLGAPPPRSLAALMPAWITYVWGYGLLLSGTIGVGSIFLVKHIETALLLEMASMLLGAAALSIIIVATFVFLGWGGFFAGGFCIAWGVANLARANQIRRNLLELKL